MPHPTPFRVNKTSIKRFIMKCRVALQPVISTNPTPGLRSASCASSYHRTHEHSSQSLLLHLAFLCPTMTPAERPQWNSSPLVKLQPQPPPRARAPSCKHVFPPEVRAHLAPMCVIKWSSDCHYRWWQSHLFMRAAGCSPSYRITNKSHESSSGNNSELAFESEDWYWNKVL